VVATSPEPFAVLTEPFRGPVRFEFDERISERVASGTLDQAVVVSPRTGQVRVGHGRQSIEVDLEGGFRPGLVYRVTLLPVVRDLFNNQLRTPFEVVFSTGGEYNASAVAGIVFDRVTAEGVDALEVVAMAEGGDSVPYHARTDTGGVYVFRYLPPARYRVTAFQDRNRDGLVDRMELQGSGTFDVAGSDTIFADIGVLQPDTTPARLTRATVLDSLTVLVEFDDYLDPETRSDLFDVRVVREDSTEMGRVSVFHEREYVAWVRQLADSFAALDSAEARRRAEEALEEIPVRGDTLPLDSIRGDTSRADTGRVTAPRRPLAVPRPPQSTHPLPPTLPSASGGGRPSPGARSGSLVAELLAPDGRPLPSRRLVLRVPEFLRSSLPYRVRIAGVINVAGVGRGEGEAVVVREPPPDTATADSAAADTVPPDTMATAPDTIPPDTMDAVADTVPPDTGRAGTRLVPMLVERRR